MYTVAAKFGVLRFYTLCSLSAPLTSVLSIRILRVYTVVTLHVLAIHENLEGFLETWQTTTKNCPKEEMDRSQLSRGRLDDRMSYVTRLSPLDRHQIITFRPLKKEQKDTIKNKVLTWRAN